MKKIILTLLLFIFMLGFTFSEDLPTFLVETNVGYSIGIKLENALQIDARLIYSFRTFGITLQAGSLLTDKSTIHLFIAPAYYFLNNQKIRIPLAVGFDLFHGKIVSYGIGSMLSVHYRLSKKFYAGGNLGLTYIFNKVYDEFVGYETKKIVYNETILTQTLPVYESKSHYGVSFYIRPSLVVGLQF
jgi:hypothetical protein